MAPNQDDLLVRAAILAETDAIFWPRMERESDCWAPVHVARWAYPTRGVAWASKASSEAGRKRTQLVLEALVARGDVTVTRDRTKTTRVKLSGAADASTRASLGLASLFLCRHVMGRIAERSTRPAAHLLDSWICERDLEPEATTTKDMLFLISCLLPALNRRWVVSMCTAYPLIYYALTDAGWNVLEDDNPPPEEQLARGDENIKALRFYEKRFNDAMNRPPRLEISDGEIGPIGLPCSMGGQAIAFCDPNKC